MHLCFVWISRLEGQREYRLSAHFVLTSPTWLVYFTLSVRASCFTSSISKILGLKSEFGYGHRFDPREVLTNELRLDENLAQTRLVLGSKIVLLRMILPDKETRVHHIALLHSAYSLFTPLSSPSVLTYELLRLVRKYLCFLYGNCS